MNDRVLVDESDVKASWVGLQDKRAQLQLLLNEIQSGIEEHLEDVDAVEAAEKEREKKELQAQVEREKREREAEAAAREEASPVNPGILSEEEFNAVQALAFAEKERLVLQSLVTELGSLLLTNLTFRKSELISQLDRLQERNLVLGDELEENSKKAEEQKSEIARLREASEGLERETTAALVDIEALKRKIELLNREISQKDEEIERQWVTLRVAQEKTIGLMGDKKKMDAEFADEVAGLSRERKELEGKIEEVQTTTNAMLLKSKRQSAYLAGQIEELNTELAAVQRERREQEAIQTKNKNAREALEHYNRTKVEQASEADA